MERDRGTAFPLLAYEMISGYAISPRMWLVIRHCALFQTPLRPGHITHSSVGSFQYGRDVACSNRVIFKGSIVLQICLNFASMTKRISREGKEAVTTSSHVILTGTWRNCKRQRLTEKANASDTDFPFRPNKKRKALSRMAASRWATLTNATSLQIALRPLREVVYL